MDPEYGALYRELYERHWWWRAREAVILDELRGLRPAGDWGAILDVGCGDGLFFPELAELGEVEGVEPETALLSSREHAGIIHPVPFDDRFDTGRRYGLILMLDVLEHLDDPADALRHARRLLDAGGVIVATVPAFQLLWTGHDVTNQHRIRYRRATFTPVVAAAGLRIRRSRYFFHWVYPAKLLVRAAEAIRGTGDGLPSIPGDPVNGWLTGWSVAESRWLRPLRLPFGGSLLAVVERPADPAG